jgi:hypothetical protein
MVRGFAASWLGSFGRFKALALDDSSEWPFVPVLLDELLPKASLYHMHVLLHIVLLNAVKGLSQWTNMRT